MVPENKKKARKMDDLRLPRTGQCKWAEGTGGDYIFPCKNRAEPGVSYCAEHHALVYISAEERRRNRESRQQIGSHAAA